MPYFARLLIALTLACLSTAAQAEKLRIVTEPWAPYVYEEAGEMKGFDYEVTAEVFKRLGVEVQWQLLPWKRCLAMIDQGLADGVLDIFESNALSSKLYYPNEPLSYVEFVLFQANARRHGVQSLDDLEGLTIGTSPGYTYAPAFHLSTQFRREPAATHEANFGKLLLGRIDLLVTDRRVGRLIIEKLGIQSQVSELPLVIERQAQYLAVRRGVGMDLLAQRFAAELRRFKREPAYAELSARYGKRDNAFARTVEQQESSTP